MSIFDRDEFNQRLFFPRPDHSPPPSGAHDRWIDAPGSASNGSGSIDVDGARLHVRMHAAPAGAPTLLLFQGNGEVVADYDDFAAQLARAGVALIATDYRGYGQSTGTPTLRTMLADARRVAEAVAPRVVMGRSLGSLAAHELYARPTDGLAGVILESGLFELSGLIRRRGLEPPAHYADDDLAAFEPAGKLARGRLPLLVLHGEHDDVIAPSEARAAHAAAAGAAKLVLIPRRGHNDISAGPGYTTAIVQFITDVAR